MDLSKATVITMFLLPVINMKLRPKLLGLKPGTVSSQLLSKPINEGRLKGDNIAFTVGGARHGGQVNDNSIKETFVANGTSHAGTLTAPEASQPRRSAG